MNEFVEECRREWRRLRVPARIADEMAAELEADLREASPEEVLGTDALDARSFAAKWADERGVSRPRRKKPLLFLATLALIAIAGVGALLATRASSTPSINPIVHVDGRSIWVATPASEVVFPPRFREDGNGTTHTIGWALLIAGLAGILFLAAIREVPDTLKASGTR